MRMSRLELDTSQSLTLCTLVGVGLCINCLPLYREVSHRYPLRKGGTRIVRARGSGWLPQTIVFPTPQGGSACELEVAMRACTGPAQGQARKESQQGGESGQEIPPLAGETLTTVDDNWRESQLSSGMWPLRGYPDSKMRGISKEGMGWIWPKHICKWNFQFIKKLLGWRLRGVLIYG